MADGEGTVGAFLAAAGWQGATSRPLAGDASSRSYARLVQGNRTAVLMMAQSAPDDQTTRFATVAGWLVAEGYSAPRILAHDPGAGLLLCEDLGDGLFARLLDADSSREMELYAAATDFLADLSRRAVPDFVAPLDGSALAALLSVLGEWYLPGIREPRPHALDDLPDAFAAEYAALDPGPPVLALRDFHAENLLWLEGRVALARVGLLDFQDAVAAHPAYDLVSLLQDARRDLGETVEADMVRRYLAATGSDEERFGATYALLGVHRGLRILGVFARLALAAGKPRYLGHIPRVWAHLRRNLEHPRLASFARVVRAAVPEPTADRLERIRQA